MDVRHFRYFLTLTEAKSFVSGARLLGISQPALSARIKELETWAGSVLFERSPRGLTLTQDGQRLLPYARDIVDALARAERFVSRRVDTSIAIGVTQTPEAVIIPRLIVAATEVNPPLRLQIHRTSVTQLIEMLKRNSLHAMLSYRVLNADPLITIPLYFEDLYLVGPAAVIGTEPRIDFAELARFLLVLDPPGHATRIRLDDAAFRTKTKLKVAEEIEPVNARKAIIEKKGYCTVVSKSLYADQIVSGLFACRRIERPRLTRTLGLTVNSSISQKRASKLLTIIRAEGERLIRGGEVDWISVEAGLSTG